MKPVGLSLTDIRNNGVALSLGEVPTYTRPRCVVSRDALCSSRSAVTPEPTPALFLPSYVVKACQLNYRRAPRTSVVLSRDTRRVAVSRRFAASLRSDLRLTGRPSQSASPATGEMLIIITIIRDATSELIDSSPIHRSVYRFRRIQRPVDNSARVHRTVSPAAAKS